jgi:amino acid permease
LEDTWSPEDEFETMSSSAYVINIVADLVPSGFLSISYGMQGIGYFPSFIVLVIIMLIAGFTMFLSGRACKITGHYDFASQWASTIGPRTAWIPLAVIVIVGFGALLCYACYCADLLSEVMPFFNFPIPRGVCLVAMSLFPTLPLCYLKNLSALAYSSSVAGFAMVYVAIVMLVRAFDGSYAQGGQFFGAVHVDVPAGGSLWTMKANSIIILNILSMAFHCHCNACKYYRELNKVSPNQFGKTTLIGMSICGVLYAVMGFSGFKTFGLDSAGTILQSYAEADVPINIGRVLVSLSLIASFGIMFVAFREAVMGLVRFRPIWVHALERVWEQDVLSTVLVLIVMVVGIFCKDTGLTDGFVGALCGNAIVFVIPTVLYVAAVKTHLDMRRNNRILAACYFIITLGVVFAIAGCVCLVVFEIVEDTAPILANSERLIREAQAHIGRHYWYVR